MDAQIGYDAADIIPRFFRVIGHTTDNNIEQTLHKLRVAGPGKLLNAYPVRWLPRGFFAVPGNIPMSSLGGEEGPISCGAYPMDAASGLSVLALMIDLLNDMKSKDPNSVSTIRKVCDICCCPGSKDQMICDILALSALNVSPSNPTPCLLVGVDISPNRMQLCKSLLRKSNFSIRSSEANERQRSFRSGVRHLLYLADGTTFGTGNQGSLIFDSNVLDLEMDSMGSRKRLNKSARQREMKKLRLIEQNIQQYNASAATSSSSTNIEAETSSPPLTSSSSSSSVSLSLHASEIVNPFNDFDAVLVDAECTHDGSYRHLRYTHNHKWSSADDSAERNHSGIDKEEDDMLSSINTSKLKPKASTSYHDPCRLESIEKLQRGLIHNGFKILKPGGVLVYSTCSLQECQNEDVIRWLLAEEPCAQLEPVVFSNLYKDDDNHEDETEDTTSKELLNASQNELSTLLESLTDPEKALIIERVAKYVAGKKYPPYEHGAIPGTIRMSIRTGTSGLFIAKIRKKL